MSNFPLDNINYFQSDWYGKKPIRKCGFSLSTNSSYLVFTGLWHGPPLYSSNGALGTFREKLWEEEVVELFIRYKDREDYLEFNLSPHGEWWGAYFLKYRERECVLADWKERSLVSINQEQNTWTAELRIPRNLLEEIFPIDDQTIFNVCAILGDEEKQYFTFLEPQSEKPDFHKIVYPFK